MKHKMCSTILAIKIGSAACAVQHVEHKSTAFTDTTQTVKHKLNSEKYAAKNLEHIICITKSE